MARRPRVSFAGVPMHVIHRGNDRMAMFRADHDRIRYLGQLREACDRFGVQVHAYVLMTNHVHLLLTPSDSFATSRTMQRIGVRYVRYFNARYGRTGTLLEGRFRSSLVNTDRYVLACSRYIELNPVRAGIVAHPHEHRWSSHASNALGLSDPLVTPHDVYIVLGRTSRERCNAYSSLFRDQLEPGEFETLREAIRRGQSTGEAAAPARDACSRYVL